MAGTTLLFLQPSVESLVLKDIRFHLLVTIRTQSGLCLLVKPDMAFIAILFELGVPFDHFPRHQRRLRRAQCHTGKGQGQSQED
jgi:hypothetical protein